MFVLMQKEVVLDKEEYMESAIFITKKEAAIIREISDGLSSKEISSKMGMTHKTVEVHRHNILKKTGYKNFTHLIASFIRKGIIK